MKKHEEFEKSVQTQGEKIDSLEKLANELVGVSYQLLVVKFYNVSYL